MFLNEMAEITNRLGELRRKRGVSAIHMASAAGVSRQTIHAMEAGAFVPNTAVALRLAQELDTTVEELFALPETAAARALSFEQATPMPDSSVLETGQAVQLCRVGRRLMASPSSAISWLLPPADAVVAPNAVRQGKTRVQIVQTSNLSNRLLVAGCDPGVSVLSRHVRTAGIELVLAHRNSSQALALLKEGCVHIAGTHLRDPSSGDSNLLEIGRFFPKNSVAVVTFAVWEEGIVTAKRNPKGIQKVDDLARKDVTIVNREAGSGSRALLDAQLLRVGIDRRHVRGYDQMASGHLQASWQVQAGFVDCCIATQAAARCFGLNFISLVSERYDLVIRKQHLDMPRMQQVLDILNRSSLRREMGGFSGYEMSMCGKRIL